MKKNTISYHTSEVKINWSEQDLAENRLVSIICWSAIVIMILFLLSPFVLLTLTL